jgi:hypothetical protein
MYCAGIDYHKRSSVVCVHDAQGRWVQEQRVDHAFPEVFQRLSRRALRGFRFPGPARGRRMVEARCCPKQSRKWAIKSNRWWIRGAGRRP